MGRRHEQIRHREKMHEIRDIMQSMKTLSIMEMHKLEQVQKPQHAMTETIELIAADFLHYYPQALLPDNASPRVNIVIGSERGFCGDYNEKLLQYIEQITDEQQGESGRVIAVGRKLNQLLEENRIACVAADGASVAEDVAAVASNLITLLAEMEHPFLLTLVYHNSHQGVIEQDELLPPFVNLEERNDVPASEPLLHLEPSAFFLELADYYLFNALYRGLYLSLLSENQHRVQHLENAVHFLDEKTEILNQKINHLRQEEIIEEIEVILLNASSV